MVIEKASDTEVNIKTEIVKKISLLQLKAQKQAAHNQVIVAQAREAEIDKQITDAEALGVKDTAS